MSFYHHYNHHHHHCHHNDNDHLKLADWSIGGAVAVNLRIRGWGSICVQLTLPHLCIIIIISMDSMLDG